VLLHNLNVEKSTILILTLITINRVARSDDCET